MKNDAGKIDSNKLQEKVYSKSISAKLSLIHLCLLQYSVVNMTRFILKDNRFMCICCFSRGGGGDCSVFGVDSFV